MQQAIEKFMELAGAMGACVVDVDSGMMLASTVATGAVDRLDLELAAASSSQVLRAQRHALAAASEDDPVEDILVSLKDQYHLLRILEGSDGYYLYAVIDRRSGNLAMARHTLARLQPTVSAI